MGRAGTQYAGTNPQLRVIEAKRQRSRRDSNQKPTTPYRRPLAVVLYHHATQNGGNDAARTAAQVASLGPSVSARASRFDTSVRDGGSKYRNEARELLNKWTSRERNNGELSIFISTSFKMLQKLR
ncbi:hypothetical protein COOONC_18438 [Cooperia oncophora]